MSDLIHDTETYVGNYLDKNLDSKFLYHNLRHTQRVVKSTKELLDHYDLDAKENDIITLAAWFHDTGYTKGSSKHEKASCQIAREFLLKQKYAESGIQKVCDLIMATEQGYEPEELAEKILRDADSSHLGKDSYPETTELLREELKQLGIASFSQEEWCDENIRMFRSDHRFHTEYALENWQPQKDENLRELIRQKQSRSKLAKKERLKAKFKNESPERGIQTMFRVTMRNHLKLSDIADTKANILLSVNAIIISLVLANLIPKLDNPSNDYLIYPTGIFILFSIASMILSIMATRPNVTSGEFTKEDVEKKKVNLLFFGNFHKMQLQDYEWAIQELIKDKTYVYTSLTKDLYFLGVVLDRKYKLLRWTYTIFMIGMVLSVIAFFVALKFYGPAVELPT